MDRRTNKKTGKHTNIQIDRQTKGQQTDIQSNSAITNRLGLTKFVRYNREFVVSEFVNAVDMDFGTEKM